MLGKCWSLCAFVAVICAFSQHRVYQYCFCRTLYLKNFTAAQFYHPPSPDARAQLESVSGKSLEELEALYDHRNVNTASTAVLWHNLPTLPADEGCALIYTALQVNFLDFTLNVNALPTSDHLRGFLKCRNRWPLKWQDLMFPGDGILPEIETIVADLEELGNRRADDAYTAEHIQTTVHKAVKAVYRLKSVVNDAMAMNNKVSTRSTLAATASSAGSSAKSSVDCLWVNRLAAAISQLPRREEDEAAAKAQAAHEASTNKLIAGLSEAIKRDLARAAERKSKRQKVDMDTHSRTGSDTNSDPDSESDSDTDSDPDSDPDSDSDSDSDA